MACQESQLIKWCLNVNAPLYIIFIITVITFLCKILTVRNLTPSFRTMLKAFSKEGMPKQEEHFICCKWYYGIYCLSAIGLTEFPLVF
jgi:hypothetical protein